MQFLETPLQVSEGDALDIYLSHDATKISFKCFPEGVAPPEEED